MRKLGLKNIGEIKLLPGFFDAEFTLCDTTDGEGIGLVGTRGDLESDIIPIMSVYEFAVLLKDCVAKNEFLEQDIRVQNAIAACIKNMREKYEGEISQQTPRETDRTDE